MFIYVILGFCAGDVTVLGVTLTQEDAQKFIDFYKMGIAAACFDSYDGFDIEMHHVTVFEDYTSYKRKDEK